jgi:hypothetical protein
MRVATILLAAMLVACSADHGAPGPPAQGKLHARVEFVESDFKTPRVDAPPDGLYVAFALSSGDLFANFSDDDFARDEIAQDRQVELDLAQAESAARRAARPVRIREGRVTGTPRTLGLARVGTFTKGWNTGWVNPRTGDKLILAYLDAPGRIVGTLSEAGHEYRFNIAVTKPGFVWLTTKKTSEKTSVISVVEPPRELVLRVGALDH